jgi:hypothetical protein
VDEVLESASSRRLGRWGDRWADRQGAISKLPLASHQISKLPLASRHLYAAHTYDWSHSRQKWAIGLRLQQLQQVVELKLERHGQQLQQPAELVLEPL